MVVDDVVVDDDDVAVDDDNEDDGCVTSNGYWMDGIEHKFHVG